jgi:hypothetical protein
MLQPGSSFIVRKRRSGVEYTSPGATKCPEQARPHRNAGVIPVGGEQASQRISASISIRGAPESKLEAMRRMDLAFDFGKFDINRIQVPSRDTRVAG